MTDASRLLDYAAARTLGARVARLGDGEAVIECPANAGFENPFAWQGGFLAAVADAAAVAALGTRVPEIESFTTTTFNAVFLRPVPKGSTVVADARVLRSGRRTAVVEVDVRASGADAVSVRFTGTFLLGR